MNQQQIVNSPEKPTRRHTINITSQQHLPHYDFVLPSYTRDRRVSSITTIIPPTIIINDSSTNVNNLPNSEENPSSSEATNHNEGDHSSLRILSSRQFLILMSLLNQ